MSVKLLTPIDSEALMKQVEILKLEMLELKTSKSFTNPNLFAYNNDFQQFNKCRICGNNHEDTSCSIFLSTLKKYNIDTTCRNCGRLHNTSNCPELNMRPTEFRYNERNFYQPRNRNWYPNSYQPTNFRQSQQRKPVFRSKNYNTNQRRFRPMGNDAAYGSYQTNSPFPNHSVPQIKVPPSPNSDLKNLPPNNINTGTIPKNPYVGISIEESENNDKRNITGKPIAFCEINKKKVSVLFDSGADTSIAKSSIFTERFPQQNLKRFSTVGGEFFSTDNISTTINIKNISLSIHLNLVKEGVLEQFDVIIGRDFMIKHKVGICFKTNQILIDGIPVLQMMVGTHPQTTPIEFNNIVQESKLDVFKQHSNTVRTNFPQLTNLKTSEKDVLCLAHKECLLNGTCDKNTELNFKCIPNGSASNVEVIPGFSTPIVAAITRSMQDPLIYLDDLFNE